MDKMLGGVVESKDGGWDALMWLWVFSEVSRAVQGGEVSIPERMEVGGEVCWGIEAPFALVLSDAELPERPLCAEQAKIEERLTEQVRRMRGGWWRRLFESKKEKLKRGLEEAQCLQYVGYALRLVEMQRRMHEQSSALQGALDCLLSSFEFVEVVQCQKPRRIAAPGGWGVGRSIEIKVGTTPELMARYSLEVADFSGVLRWRAVAREGEWIGQEELLEEVWQQTWAVEQSQWYC